MNLPPITDCDQLPTDGWRRLCREREDYRQAWMEGRGPGQAPVNTERIKKPSATKTTSDYGCCGDKKKALTVMGEAWDVIKAVGKFVGSLGQLTSKEEYHRRLDICTACENRGDERVKHNPHRCGECGCFVAIKAQAVAWECPIEKWSISDPQ